MTAQKLVKILLTTLLLLQLTITADTIKLKLSKSKSTTDLYFIPFTSEFLSIEPRAKIGIPTAMPKTKETPKKFIQNLQSIKSQHFIGQIALGSDKEVFKVEFDLNSALLWVSDISNPSMKSRKRFSCTKEYSDSCNKTPYTLEQIIYNSKQAVVGKIIEEDVWIPNLVSQNHTEKSHNRIFTKEEIQIQDGEYVVNNDVEVSWGQVKNQNVLLADVTPGFDKKNLHADGFFGQGPTDHESYKSVMTNLFEKKVINNQIFAFFLSASERVKPSEQLIGGYDEILVKKSPGIVWVDNHYKDSGSWNVYIKNVLIDDTPVQNFDIKGQTLVPKQSYKGTIDINSQMIVLTLQDIEAYIKSARQRGLKCIIKDKYVVCGRDITMREWGAKELPGLAFMIGKNDSKKFVIDNNKMLGRCERKTDYSKITKVCLINIMVENSGDRVLGIPFMQMYYTIFDRISQKIGWAQVNLNELAKIDGYVAMTPVALKKLTNSQDKRRKSTRFVTVLIICIMIVLIYLFVTQVVMESEFDDVQFDDSIQEGNQGVIERTGLVHNQRSPERQVQMHEGIKDDNALNGIHVEKENNGQNATEYNPYNPYNASKIDIDLDDSNEN